MSLRNGRATLITFGPPTRKSGCKTIRRPQRKAAAEKRKAAALKKQNELLVLQQNIQQNISNRVAAIISIQNQIVKAEADAIEDGQERLLRLEELKAKAINEQREKQFDAFVAQCHSDWFFQDSSVTMLLTCFLISMPI